jgi:hypothetical protein
MKHGGDDEPMKRQCKATVAATGQRCRLPPIIGGAVCHKHGGSARQVKAAAARRVTEAKALETYQRYSPNGDGQPVNVVAELVHLVAVVPRFARFAEARLAALGEEDWQPGNETTMTEVRLFQKATEAAGRLLTDVARLGIEAAVTRQAGRLERSRAERIVEAFEEALDVLDLTGAQRARAGSAMAALLLHMTGEEAPGGGAA